MVHHRAHLYCLWHALCSPWQGATRAVLILAARTLKNADVVNNVCCWGPLLSLLFLSQSSVCSLWDKGGRKPGKEEKTKKEPKIPGTCPLRRAKGQTPQLCKWGRTCRNQCFFKGKPVEKLSPVLGLSVACRHPGLILEMLSIFGFHRGQGVDGRFCDVSLENGASLSFQL